MASRSELFLSGRVVLDATHCFAGQPALRLERTPEEMTSGVVPSARFPEVELRGGLWDLAVTLSSELESPDSSYCGVMRFEALDAAGARVVGFELGLVSGSVRATTFRRRVELPDGVARGRFVATLEKASGVFYAGVPEARYAGPILAAVSAIKLAPEAVGSLFLPGASVAFGVVVETRRELAVECRCLRVRVTDYWGAEMLEGPLEVALEESEGRYVGRLDLTARAPEFVPEVGRYYEVHVAVPEAEAPEPTREMTAFAVLPEAVTRKYPPLEVPFTASGWNPGVPGFFPLCDRLGFRVANVYTSWKAEPPYELDAPNIEELQSLGMGALLRSMVFMVEGHLKGHEAYTPEVLREGARRMVERFRGKMPMIVRNGNEPHPADDAQALEMIAAYRAVYEGVKAADPSVVVTSTSCGAEDQFFRLGFQQGYDVYDFHQYSDAGVIPEDFAKYRALVERYGGDRPIWTTEIGRNSQGMSREAVSNQMVRMFATFFGCGGLNLSWFGIMWPDPDGTIVGSNGDSFDVFRSKYSLYAPKLTAVTEYHLINAICIKKCIDRKVYPDGTNAVLFRDQEGRCLVIAWKDGARREARLPLGGVAHAKLIHLDGASVELRPHEGAIALTLSDEPVMLEFEASQFVLPTESWPDALCAHLVGNVPSIVKGASVELPLEGEDVEALHFVLPPRWSIARQNGAWIVSAPAQTSARIGRIFARLPEGAGEIALPVGVTDPLGLTLVPVPYDAAETAGIELVAENRGPTPATFDWKLAVTETYTMHGGTFDLTTPEPFVAESDAAGTLTLAPHETQRAALRLPNLDPLNLYRAQLEMVQRDADGNRIVSSQERLFGGCVGVPRVERAPVFDGTLGDPLWERARPLHLDREGQFAILTRATARRDRPEDLSAIMRFLWDDQYLYLGVAVQDNVFCNPECDDAIWRGDGLQFLVDPCRLSDEKPGKYDYCLGLGTKGIQAWCACTADAARAPTGNVTDFRMNITPTGHRGDMIYEIAIPWNRLAPFQPAVGADLGLALIVNNDDGFIRDSFMAWFGCAHSKQMSMAGDLILLP